MRIVFFGASELGWHCCNALFEIGQDVVGIFSIPQQFRISWSSTPVTNVRFRSFEDLAAQYSIPLIYVTKKMSDPEYLQSLYDLRPDLLVVIGWYYMIPRSLRNTARLGAVGIHASLLPEYRGGAPLVWAMINGETRTGVSLFHFADGVDDGDIIGQESFEITETDEIGDVVAKSTVAALDLVRIYIPLLATGEAPRYVQDHSRATYVPQRKPEDGLIDWSTMSARAVNNWIRAQSRPYPGTFTYLEGEKITIWKARLPDYEIPLLVDQPGILHVVQRDNRSRILVSCADGRPIELREMQRGSDDSDPWLSAEQFIMSNAPVAQINQLRFSNH